MSQGSDKNEHQTVLYTDDDAASVLMAEATLSAAGYTVVAASNGQESIDLFHQHSPDLIVMDAVMPGIDGFEAIRKIRQSPDGQHVPIMMVTGLDDHESISVAFEIGATDFLTKPVNFHVLPHRINYMLRSAQVANELRNSQERLNNAQRIARIGSWEVDPAVGSVNLSEVCKSLLGFEGPEFVPDLATAFQYLDREVVKQIMEKYREAVDDSVPFSMEFGVRHPVMQRELTLHVQAVSQLDKNEKQNIIGTLQDVTEISNAQRQIHNLAYYDVVTGLPNRAFLNERLCYALAMAERGDQKFALLFLDLDHFKQVNDTLGHDAGDELLRHTADRLNEAVRQYDAVVRSMQSLSPDDNTARSDHTVARLGGDEFIVLVTNIKSEQDAAIVAKRISEVIAQPYNLGGTDASISTTIGISVYPNDGEDAETLLKHADIAMYHAKENGRNSMQFYSREIHDASLTRFALEKKLKSAIETESLDIVYQPKICMSSGQIIGVEALVRWHDEELGTVSPSEFIPLAEDTGLIIPLGRWVMLQACKQMKEWGSAGLQLQSMAINCSAVQFMRSDMIGLVTEVLELSGLESQYLEIELTESLLLQNTEQGIRILNGLKARGIQVSIDDFGTGFSSLSYLKKLPVDKLKIDHSFVRDLAVDAGDEAIVSAIITLSHKLSLDVVAEGVETEEQYQALVSMNCDQIQGYLVSKPLSADDFLRWFYEADYSRLLRLAS